MREETPVKRVLKDDGGRVIGVEAVERDGKTRAFFAPVTIDCSGREQVTTAREGWRVKDPQLNKLAIWTYFRGAKRDPGLDEGNTTVAYVEGRGWFWYIPLKDDVISVGIVAEKDYLFSESKDPAEIMCREIGRNAWIKDHLSIGKQFGEYWVTSEFSYRSKYCAADGLLLAGDAFAFLDPVFSSGVYLALKSGEMAADAVDAALTAGDTSGANRAFHQAYPEQRGRLTDSLIGDLFSANFSELHAAMREFAELPAELSHGRAPVGAAV